MLSKRNSIKFPTALLCLLNLFQPFSCEACRRIRGENGFRA